MSSFFKKPSWAKAESQTTAEFYRRSEQLYSDIVAGEQHDTDTGSDGERSVSQAEDSTKHMYNKERRVSQENIADIVPSTPDMSVAIESTYPNFSKLDASTSTLPQPVNAASVCSANTLSSDQETTEVGFSKTTRKAPSESTHYVSDDDISSEEEFPELARKARERASQRAMLSDHGTPIDRPPNHQSSGSVRSTSSRSPINAVSGQPCANPVEDPVVQILITSTLDNTKPLLVHRRLTQNLGDVRKAWCSKQGFSPNAASSVLLTWKGKRLFDITTCKGLGIQDLALDAVFSPNCFSNKDGVLRVHMEAVTEELFKTRKRQNDSDPAQEQGSQAPDGEIVNDTALRITLRSLKLKEFKLKVLPTTQMSYILKSFCTAREVDSDRMVELHFDGACLDPDSSVEENDIDDLDCIDVVIK